jgi:thymidylate kinase
MRGLRNNIRGRIVSFSGVDGAGKSTQIDRLCDCLRARGLRVRLLRFWDDIAQLKTLREGASHQLFKGDKGVGSPETPINRQDKNVGGWPMTCFRYFLYLIDAISLRRVFKKALLDDADIIIFDRYTYDELANLDLTQSLTRSYAYMIMFLIPRPDISFVLDVEPEAARARKPEYPIEFVDVNRRAYLELNRIFGGFTTIAPMGIEATHEEVKMKTLRIVVPEVMTADNHCGVAQGTQAMDGSRTGASLF